MRFIARCGLLRIHPIRRPRLGHRGISRRVRQIGVLEIIDLLPRHRARCDRALIVERRSGETHRPLLVDFGNHSIRGIGIGVAEPVTRTRRRIVDGVNHPRRRVADDGRQPIERVVERKLTVMNPD